MRNFLTSSVDYCLLKDLIKSSEHFLLSTFKATANRVQITDKAETHHKIFSHGMGYLWGIRITELFSVEVSVSCFVIGGSKIKTPRDLVYWPRSFKL